MRQRLRSHLTYANVISTLALFLVLGGGTALAAYVVGSNSQIGPGTVSGHKPPSGDHANIIAGSVNGPDVQDLVFQPLTMKNGWASGTSCQLNGTPAAIAKSVEGVVYLRGVVCRKTSSSVNPFAVPSGFRPSKNIFHIPVAQSVQDTGALQVSSGGEVFLSSDPDHGTSFGFSNLDGVNYTLPF
jgi:hypothetical protein